MMTLDGMRFDRVEDERISMKYQSIACIAFGIAFSNNRLKLRSRKLLCNIQALNGLLAFTMKGRVAIRCFSITMSSDQYPDLLCRNDVCEVLSQTKASGVFRSN